MDVEKIAREAKAASRELARAPTDRKDRALRRMAEALRAAAKGILEANAIEVDAARSVGKTGAFVERLALDAKGLDAACRALEHVASLPDPIGQLRDYATRPNGLRIRRMRVPLGVIAIIYESRPQVTADAAGLCLKSGNAAILRGGKEALRTNARVAQALKSGIEASGLPSGSVGFLDDPDRELLKRLLSFDGLVDLVIPRGGPELTRAVRKDSMIPVLSHDKGVCHVYVDETALPAMAESICLNAKVERPGVCNAMETLLVHHAIAPTFLPKLAERYRNAGVELRGCPRARRVVPWMRPATEEDWDTEYLDLILSIRLVDSVEEAIEHIACHGTGLAEAIVTSDSASVEKFQREVDAGAVFVNASTRFTDGGEFGMGAEMGISTQKLHARGPVGLVELTCEKYVVTGTGQVRESRK